MKKGSILRQILISYVSLSFVLVFFILIYFIHYFYNYQLHSTHQTVKTLWSSMEHDFQLALDYPFNTNYIKQSSQNLGDHLKCRVTVLNYKKELIYQYIPKYVEDEMKNDSLLYMKSEELIHISLSDSITHNPFQGEQVSVFPVRLDDRFLGYVLADMPLSRIYDPWYNFIFQIIQITAVLFVIAFVIFLILTQNIVMPIKNLIVVTKRIAKGDLDISGIPESNNEIGTLAQHMQEMSVKLKESFVLISKQRETLDTMLNTIQQALWIVNSHGIILLANATFKRIVNHQSPEGKYIWEIFRHPNLNNILKQALDESKNITLEIEYENAIFLCSTTLMPQSRQVIFSLLDISQIKEMEKLKRDFVSNVSHELRTPLTAIKGFVETLSEEASEEQLSYLKIIERNTDRLINIVKDLLLLSNLEQIQEIEHDQINIPDLIENLFPLFKDKLQEKSMTLSLSVETDQVLIIGDSFKIEQIFVNLIDNAIKYAGKGNILISLSQHEQMMKISINDEGDGISKEHLPRLFERFYVIDKSRSKKMGGTGLGLSIVKHIVFLHHGKIQVHSNENEGTTFIIYLPLIQVKK